MTIHLSGTRTAVSGAQQAVPNRESKKNGEHADHEKRGNPALRLLRFAADTDHYPSDLIGALRLGAPEAVLIGLENKFALSIGAPGDYRSLSVARGDHRNSAVRSGFPSWVANCTVTSCVANRSKATECDGAGKSAVVRVKT